MSELNMNTLHIHATDDEGWRLEIPSLPELTNFGAFRCESAECLDPQYGSGPHKTPNPQNGFITESDYEEVLQFAFDKKIQIIIEINGPGHARAAIFGMKKRDDPDMFLHDPDQTIFDVPSGLGCNIIRYFFPPTRAKI